VGFGGYQPLDGKAHRRLADGNEAETEAVLQLRHAQAFAGHPFAVKDFGAQAAVGALGLGSAVGDGVHFSGFRIWPAIL
jgi:hypothetical protein